MRKEHVRTIAVLIGALVIGIVAGSIVAQERTRKTHNAFLHQVWNAAPIVSTPTDKEDRAELYGESPVLAYEPQSETGPRVQILFVRLNDGSEVLLSTRTVNMWGYETYGWTDWCRGHSEAQIQEILGVLGAWLKTKS